MSDTPTPDTGTAPATPGQSAPEITPDAQAATLLTGRPDAPAPAAPEAKPAEVAAPVIPDKYEFKLGEGRELDSGLIDAVSPVLKELGLTQDQASKLVDAYDKYGQTFEAKQETDFKEFMAQTAKDNIAAIKKEWGNDFQANLAIAQRGLARFLSPTGKKALDDSGLGNNPEFLKAFYQAGKMIQEDTPPAHIQPSPNGASKLFTKSVGVN